jgi:hypothetical protein
VKSVLHLKAINKSEKLKEITFKGNVKLFSTTWPPCPMECKYFYQFSHGNAVQN